MAAHGVAVDIRQPRYALHAAIALRDLWLAAIMIALVLCKEWRPLALVFGLGTFVCLGDAVIAARSSGTFASVLFHLFAGGLCAGLAGMLCRLSKRSNGEAGHVRP